MTIAGGKLTGYRKMAQHVVDNVLKGMQPKLEVRKGDRADTKRLRISGGDVGGSSGFAAFVEQKTRQAQQIGLSVEVARRMAQTYGSNMDALLDIERTASKEEAAKRGLPHELYVALLYAIHQEMAVKPVDFLIRRTGALLFDIDLVKAYKYHVIACMKDLLNWDEETKRQYSEELEQELRDAVTPYDSNPL